MQKLEEIKQQFHGDIAMCKNKLYDTWLRQQTDPSWGEIVDALEQIEENNIADRIRRMFLPAGIVASWYHSNVTVLLCCMYAERPYLVRQSSGYDSPVLGYTQRSSSFGSEAVAVVPNPVVPPLLPNPMPATTPLVGAVSPVSAVLPAATVPSIPAVAMLPLVNVFHQGMPLPSGYIVPQGTIVSPVNVAPHPSTTTIHPVSLTTTSPKTAPPVQQSPAYPRSSDSVEQESKSIRCMHEVAHLFRGVSNC